MVLKWAVCCYCIWELFCSISDLVVVKKAVCCYCIRGRFCSKGDLAVLMLAVCCYCLRERFCSVGDLVVLKEGSLVLLHKGAFLHILQRTLLPSGPIQVKA